MNCFALQYKDSIGIAARMNLDGIEKQEAELEVYNKQGYMSLTMVYLFPQTNHLHFDHGRSSLPYLKERCSLSLPK